MGTLPRSAYVAYALTVLTAVVVHAVTDNDVLAEACYLGVLVGASVVAWVGVARWPRERRLVPCLVAGGIALTALGDVIWVALERAGKDTDVSVADLPWYVSYVLLCMAIWIVLSQSRDAAGPTWTS
jgi:hypothetical protein